MARKGERLAPETRRKLRARKAQLRARRKVTPKDLRLLRAGQHSAFTHSAVRALLRHGEAEALAFIEALGGPDHISPQRRALVEDSVTLGVLARSLVIYYAQKKTPDANVAGRVAALLTSRRQALVAVGLNRVEWGMTRREPRPEEERARWDERQRYREEEQEFFDYYDTVDFYGPADDEVTMDGRSMRSRVHDPGPTERDFKHFRVPPGEYTIVLTVGDLVMKRTARILADQWYDQ